MLENNSSIKIFREEIILFPTVIYLEIEQLEDKSISQSSYHVFFWF